MPRATSPGKVSSGYYQSTTDPEVIGTGLGLFPLVPKLYAHAEF